MHFQVQIYSGQNQLFGEYDKCTWATLEGESLSEESGERYVFPENHHLSHERWEFWGTASCQVQVTILPPPRPSCSLLASSRWIHRGESTTLSWTTQYAEYGWLLQQSVSLPTGLNVSPSRTTLYILTVLNASGLNICTDFVCFSLKIPIKTVHFLEISCTLCLRNDTFSFSILRMDTKKMVPLRQSSKLRK